LPNATSRTESGLDVWSGPEAPPGTVAPPRHWTIWGARLPAFVPAGRAGLAITPPSDSIRRANPRTLVGLTQSARHVLSRSQAMFRYPTSYRFYTLSKIGFSAAYLWYVSDFFRIHIAIWNHLSLLLPDPRNIVLSGNQQLDAVLRGIAIFLSGRAMVWAFALSSPVAAGLFLWGRHKWLQLAVGCWISFSMISLNSLVGVFSSTVDVWVNLVFVTYSLVALVSPADEWDKSEAGFSLTRWGDNPTLASAFAWLVVWLQCLV
jgi:hypothetical protein